MTKMSGRSV